MNIQITLYRDPILGAALGIGAGLIDDWRQYNLQGGLNKQQEAMNKRMMDHQTKKQLEMWEKTGYGPTVEQMKKAGLNPALMYGMGGPGAQTVGGEMPTGTAPHANTRGSEVIGGAGMGIQAALLQAQKENIQADTAQKRAATEKTAGVDTQEAQVRMEKMAQETDNMREEWQIKRLQQKLSNIEIFEKQATQQDRLKQIETQTAILGKQLEIINNDAEIKQETKDELIKITQQELIAAVLRNALTGAQIGQTTTATALDQQKIKESVNDIMIKWKSLGNEQEKTQYLRMNTFFQTDPVNQATDQISRMIDNIFFIMPKIQDAKPLTPIGFKR